VFSPNIQTTAIEYVTLPLKILTCAINEYYVNAWKWL